MKRSLAIALLLAFVAVLWVASGYLGAGGNDLEEQKPALQLADESRLPVVRVRMLTASPYIQEYFVRGQTRPAEDITLRAEVAGLVTQTHVEKGARVEAGEIIATLDPGDRLARLASAKALVAQQELELKAAESLAQRGFRAETAVAAIRAQYEAALAQVSEIETQLAKLILRAPKSGVLEDRPINSGDYLSPGEPYGRLVVLDPILVSAEVGETQVAAITRGGPARIRFAQGQMQDGQMQDGQVLEGRVSYLATTANPATRTYLVEAELPNPDYRVFGYMTAELILPLAEVPAFKISPGVLTLSLQGQIGVKALSHEGRVVFHPVTILSDEVAGIWVTAGPSELRLITVGQEFVYDGQEVDAVEDHTALPADPSKEGGR